MELVSKSSKRRDIVTKNKYRRISGFRKSEAIILGWLDDLFMGNFIFQEPLMLPHETCKDLGQKKFPTIKYYRNKQTNFPPSDTFAGFWGEVRSVFSEKQLLGKIWLKKI